MTKERRLAIEMWTNIRNMLSNKAILLNVFHIAYYKTAFCEKHDLHWRNKCWMCQYIGCLECPLKSCGRNSLYDILANEYVEKDVRVAACNNIIKALGGKA